MKLGENEVYGFNGMWDNAFQDLNPCNWGHAEIDAMSKMYRSQPTRGLDAEMWVTREVCRGACLGPALKQGNIIKAAKQMGLETLTIHSPTESITIFRGEVVSVKSY